MIILILLFKCNRLANCTTMLKRIFCSTKAAEER